jgi:hypothetical protein
MLNMEDIDGCRENLISKEGKSFDQADRECTSGGRRKSVNDSQMVKPLQSLKKEI